MTIVAEGCHGGGTPDLKDMMLGDREYRAAGKASVKFGGEE